MFIRPRRRPFQINSIRCSTCCLRRMCFGTRFRLETYSFYVRIYSLIFSNSINFMKQRYLNTYSKIHFRSKKKFFPHSNSYRRRTVLFQLKNDDHEWLSPLIIVFSLLLPLGLYLLSPHFFFFFFLPVLSFRNHQRSFLPPHCRRNAGRRSFDIRFNGVGR